MVLESIQAALRRATPAVVLGAALATLGSPRIAGDADRAGESHPQMWTGRWVDVPVAEGHPRKPAAEQFAREQKERWQEAQARIEKDGLSTLSEQLRKELVQYRIDKQTEGMDAEQASLELMGLTARTSWQTDYPGRWGLLVDLRLELGKLCVEGGHPEAFTKFYAGSVLLPGGIVLPPYELVPASAELMAQDEAAIADPKLVAFGAEVQSASQPRAQAASASGQGIEEAVRDALAAGRDDQVKELGTRVAPILEEMVRASPNELPQQAGGDALASLLDLREMRGAQLILELLNTGGFLFKKRVLRAMDNANVLTDFGTWTFAADVSPNAMGSFQPPTLVESFWLEVLTRLVSDPEVGRDSVPLVQQVACFDALDESLQRGLIQLLDSEDPDAATAVVALLKESQGRRSVLPILEHALDHHQASVRAAAASLLTLYPRSDALRARSKDSDSLIRRFVAKSLQGRTGRPMYRESDKNAIWADANSAWGLDREVDARDAPCIANLLQDAEADNRQVAMQALFAHPDLPIPAEILVALAKDSSPQLRGVLARWPPKKPADPRLLEALARDTDRDVLHELDERFEMLATTRPDGSDARDNRGRLIPGSETMWRESYLPALLTRLANPNSDELSLNSSLLIVGHDPSSAPALLREVTARGTQVAQRILLHVMANPTDEEYLFAWDSIGLDEVVAWVRAAWSLPSSVSPKKRLVDAFQTATSAAKSSLRAVLVDDQAPGDLRLFCAMQTAHWAGEAWRKELIEVIAGLGEGLYVDPSLRREDLTAAISSDIYPESERILLLEDLMALADPPEWSLNLAREALARGVPGDLAVRIVERSVKEESATWTQLAWHALKSVDLTRLDSSTELIRRVLSNPRTVGTGIEAIGRAHLDEHLPLLEEAILGRMVDAVPGSQQDRSIRQDAARALASYLSDPAAEILIKGLGATTDEDVRKACFDALDTIRRYQDEKERWTQRKSSKQAQDAAVAELAPMLADKDANVRAQAARSMGALGAVEQLPALVRLLKDSDQAVRKAAQDAIDALTAAKQAPADGKKD